MPLVSVIVPGFNHARFLETRLTSIAEQSFKDFELILLDDASTDGSREIFRRFAGLRACTLVLNDENSGSAFRQWAKGIRHAKGKYIWIAESDDVAAPEFLESMVELLEQYPGCGFAYCNSLKVDVTGRSLGVITESFSESAPLHWESSYVASGREELKRFMLLENTIPNASAVVFRRSIYDAAGGVDETMKLSADWKLWGSIMAISDVAYSATLLNQFRCHDQSVRASRKAWPGLAEDLSVMRHITRYLELSPLMKQRLDVRFWVLLLEAFRRKFPTFREAHATAKIARELHLNLSPGIVWRLLGRIFSACVKRVASLTRPTTAQR